MATRAGARDPREGERVRFVGIGGIYLYRYTLGVLFPATCKYHPSCSQYAIDAFRQYGLVRGAVLAGWRLLRCNPWSHGGVDYAKDQRLFK
jgi:putative membrane protein insertion efficiency factor